MTAHARRLSPAAARDCVLYGTTFVQDGRRVDPAALEPWATVRDNAAAEPVAVPAALIFLGGPPPCREDYASLDAWADAYIAHIVRVMAPR